MLRGSVAEGLSGSMVEPGGDGVTLLLCESGHRLPFGQVLADEAVGVLIQAALPGTVRGGEVEADATARFDVAVAMEFCAVIRGDRANGARLSFLTVNCR